MLEEACKCPKLSERHTHAHRLVSKKRHISSIQYSSQMLRDKATQTDQGQTDFDSCWRFSEGNRAHLCPLSDSVRFHEWVGGLVESYANNEN